MQGSCLTSQFMFTLINSLFPRQITDTLRLYKMLPYVDGRFLQIVTEI